MSASVALSSLGAFALVLASMFVVPFALWCNFSLARTAQLDARVSAPRGCGCSPSSSLWASLIALAVWKYGTDGRTRCPRR